VYATPASSEASVVGRARVPLRIALVSPYDYPFPGGVTEHIASLAAGLERRGHTVRILAPSSAGQEQLSGPPPYRLGSIVRVPYHGSWARITLSLGLTRKVRTILQRERFDIVHVHEPLLPMLPLVVLAQSRAATIGTFHAYWKRWRLYALGRPVLRSFSGRLDGRIAVSEAARGYVSRYFPGEYTIIPNGVDTTAFRPDLEPLPACRGHGPTILFVGRLEKRKGFIHLLRAFAEVARALPHARLLVAGAYGDTEQQRYEALARRLDVRSVSFLGPLNRSDLARCYANVDVFCAPSIEGESFGIVLLEAMACGRPVVCSDIPGYHDVVRNDVEGLLVPPGDEHALAKALLRILADGALAIRLGGAGLRRAAEFDWSVVTRRVEAYYLAILDQVLHRQERISVTTPSDRAVIFDMDGVLLDSEPLYLRALNQVLAPLGHQATAAENEQFWGMTSEECWRVIMQRYRLRGRLHDYLSRYDECVLRVLEQPITPTRGVPELLVRLRLQGARLGLASASKKSRVNATLSALRLCTAFDVVVTGDEVAHGKPSPDLFLLAARRLGVSPTRCVVIEDSPNGVLASKRAGMTAVALRTPTASNVQLNGADYVIDSLGDFPLEEVLARPNARRVISGTSPE
jgi:phosphatidylinositol alpha-mannosyltransferase